MSKILDFTASLLRRTGSFTRAGVTFGGARDLYAVLGYKTDLEYADYVARYNRGGIAKRIVDAPAKATWRLQPFIEEANSLGEETAFEKEWKKLALRLNLFHYIERVDKLASLGKYSVMVLGAGSGSLEQPLVNIEGPQNLFFVSVFSEDNAEVNAYISDPANPRFGLPEMYTIDFSSDLTLPGKSVVSPLRKKVHHSRVIHVAENLLENDIIGRPRLEAVWNHLDDLDKVTGGAAESFWMMANRGIHLNLEDGTELDPDDEKKLEDEVEEYQHNLRRMIMTRNMQLTPLGGKDVDPRGAADVLISLIAGTSEIPKRILLGSESAELASTQDRANWNERIIERQQSYGGPRILRPIIDRFIDIKALPDPVSYGIAWPDLSALSKREQAEVALRAGAAVRNFTGQDIVSKEEARDMLGLPKDMLGESLVVKANPGATE